MLNRKMYTTAENYKYNVVTHTEFSQPKTNQDKQ